MFSVAISMTQLMRSSPTSGLGSWPMTTDPGTVTWRELWLDTERLVGERTMARWICEEASGRDGAEFVSALNEPATERTVHHLDAMVARVRSGEPVQYVLGHWSFRHLDLLVDRRVLIPRPETEQLVELALAYARRRGAPIIAVDLGTGSGAIGLSLAAELPIDGTTVWLTDVSADALDVARANAAGLGLRGANTRFAGGSWFHALPSDLRGRLDLVVSNPPYIAESDGELEASVREWEPGGALFSGDDGLDAVRNIAADVMEWLAPGGSVMLEIGHRQGAAAAGLLRLSGLLEVRVEADLAGRDRFVVANAPA
jgi:release factor glutamine methyltransferase